MALLTGSIAELSPKRVRSKRGLNFLENVELKCGRRGFTSPVRYGWPMSQQDRQ